MMTSNPTKIHQKSVKQANLKNAAQDFILFLSNQSAEAQILFSVNTLIKNEKRAWNAKRSWK